MDKDRNIIKILAISGKYRELQTVREVNKIDGVNCYDPVDDPNVETIVKEYDTYDMEREPDPDTELIAELISERDAWLYRRMLEDIEKDTDDDNKQTRIIMNLGDDNCTYLGVKIAPPSEKYKEIFNVESITMNIDDNRAATHKNDPVCFSDEND